MTQNKTNSEVLFFPPIYKEKIWGGQQLKTSLKKNIPENKCIGESWELSGYGSDISFLLSKTGTKITLQDLIDSDSQALLGVSGNTESFPLLFKFIDALDKLSIQVHPNDNQARQNGWGILGKTECWYIVEAKPDARIIVGFKPGVTKDNIIFGIKNNTLDSILNYIPIQKGDLLFIPAGTVHAILDGTLIYEVQQASDTTFRMYDWARLDIYGKSRDLHIKESLAVVNTIFHNRHKIEPLLVSNNNGIYHYFRVVCDYFALEEFYFEVYGEIKMPVKQSFVVITVIDGKINLQLNNGVTSQFSKGQTILLPSNLCSQSGIINGCADTRFLLSSVPDIHCEVTDFLRSKGVADEKIYDLGGNVEVNVLGRYM